MQSFPDGFLWGTATAAHQVEGANANNDWSDWEQQPGRIRNQDRSIVACDWWKGARYREDFDLAKSLNQNALRLSLEWSRIEPTESEWNAEAIVFYRRLLGGLRERGLTPLVTLHHFTNPRWLASKGAWETLDVVPAFERYAARAVQEFGDLCDFWITINEPTVYVYAGYLNGNWPPGRKDVRLAMRVGANMLRAHAAAFHAIHRLQPNARVGAAHSIRPLLPQNPRSRLNRMVARMQHYAHNNLILLGMVDGRLRFPLGTGGVVPEAVDTQDFIGLNYYLSSRITVDLTMPTMLFGRQMPGRSWGTGFDEELKGWFGRGDLDPESLCETATWLARFAKPIYVTENGICDARDAIRPRYMVTHLAALQRAIRQGAPVKGYFHWTLVDNFEWAEGYSLRFGLFSLEAETQRRMARGSAQIYARIARENAIADELLEQYGERTQ